MSSVSPPERTSARESTPVRPGTFLLGVPLGVAIFSSTTALDVAWRNPTMFGPGSIVSNHLAMTLIATFLAALCVLAGWRWPRVGLAAGLIAVLAAATALLVGGATIVGPDGDLAAILLRGGAGTLPPLIGVVLTCSSITGLRSRPAR